MSILGRFKNIAASKFYSLTLGLSRRALGTVEALDLRKKKIPWTAPEKPLSQCKVALVTTAGLHHKDQHPFYMHDKMGDPTYREVSLTRDSDSIMITHDYYNHSDADRDINVVFPIDRLKELAAEGAIGSVAETHYSFMGHILDAHIRTLIGETAPEVALNLKSQSVDIVVLTPG
jgi:D-proline reductase (dithiol) PrdB